MRVEANCRPRRSSVPARIAALALGLAASWVSAVDGHAATPELEGFPTKLGGLNRASGILVVDLDKDGKLDVVTGAGDGFVVVGADGKVRDGFPIELKDSSTKQRSVLSSLPSSCDVNGDGKLDIVVATANKRLWIVSLDGTLLAGSPIKLTAQAKGPIACEEGPTPTLYFSTDNGSVHSFSKGSLATMANIGSAAESGVARADIDGDGRRETIVVGGDSRLHVLNDQGKDLPGFPYAMSFRSSGIPAVGDINDDGAVDIVVTSHDFKVHAVSDKGKSLPGFPVTTGYRVYSGAALADMNGDHALDIVVGSGDSKLYVIDGQGRILKGFPKKLDGRILADAAVGDVDRDGKLEMAVVSQGGTLQLLTHRGKSVRGFPFRLGGKPQVAPALADLDGDGLPELLACTGSGLLHAFKFKARGKAEKAVVAWGQVGHNSSRTGRYGPNPARFKDLGLKVQTPATTDDLVAAYRFFDLDGDKESGTKIRWYLDGKHQPALDDKTIVPKALTKKHQKWRYSLQAKENFENYGERGELTLIFSSQDQEIVNTAPAAPRIELGPTDPRTTDTLQVKIKAESVDPDGDKIAYRYIWLKDDKAQRRINDRTTAITSRFTKKGQRWTVLVVPFDGEVEGAKSTSAITVLNTLPAAAKLELEPANPRIVDTVKVRVKVAGADADSDKVTYRYRYWVNDVALNLDESRGMIPAGILRKGTKLRIEVASVDDEGVGATAGLATTVINTVPASPSVAIEPKVPKTTDDLHASIVNQMVDPDFDQVTYAHQWTRDGAPVEGPMVIPASQTKRGEKWSLTITPLDGEAKGAPVTISGIIANTAPTAPLVKSENHQPTTSQPLVVSEVRPGKDVDGDKVSLVYRWRLGGKSVSLPMTQSTVEPAQTQKGQVWVCDVSPTDGTNEGHVTRLVWNVVNTPPTTPKISVKSLEYTTAQSVGVSVDTPSSDIDGDKLEYHYRWFVNGRPMTKWPLSKSSLAAGEGKKGDRWRVDVAAYDGETEGLPVSTHFSVVNHPPVAASVTLGPTNALTTSSLRCGIEREATDLDGDKLSLIRRWFKGDQVQRLSADLEVLPPSLTRKGDVWSCDIAVSDGSVTLAPVRSKNVTIANTPPGRPRVVVFPGQPNTTDDLSCQLAELSRDADLDPVSYRYVWRVDGKPFRGSASDNPSIIAAKATRAGQTWQCLVTPSDPAASGASESSKVTVLNSPPTTPEIEIIPRRPKAKEGLRCKIKSASRDPDRDKIRYEFLWLKDGVEQSFASTSDAVPGRLVKESDLWQCKATPTDGSQKGATAVSADVIVR